MADPKATPNPNEPAYLWYQRQRAMQRRGPVSSATAGGPGGPEALASAASANRPVGEISSREAPRPDVAEQFGTQILEHPVQTGMEIGGAMAGSMVGGPIGGYFMGRIGRALLAKQAAQGAAILGGVGGRLLGSATGMLGGSEAAMAFAEETPEEKFRRRVSTFGAGLGGEAAAPIVQRALTGPVSRGIRRSITPISEEPIKVGAREVVDALGRVHIEGQPGRLSPGQAMGGWVSFLENIAKASIPGGEMMRGVQEFGRKSATALWDQTVKAFGGKVTPEQAGQVLKTALDQMPDIQRAYTKGKYSALDTAVFNAGGAPGVNLHPVAGETLSMLKRVLELNPPDPDAVRILGLVEGGAPIQPGVPAKPSTILGPSGQPAFVTPAQPAKQLTVDFEAANEIRSYLDGISRRDDLPIPGLKSRAGAVARKVDAAIEAAMLKLGPLGQDVLDAARIARETHRFGKETFNDGMIAEMLNKITPEELTSLVLRDNSPTRLNTLYDLLGNPRFQAAVPDRDAVWKLLQGAWVEQVERGAGRGPVAEALGTKKRLEFGELDGAAILNQARDAGSTVSALFRDPAQRRALMVSGHAIDMAQNPGGSRAGTLFIGMRQASELSNLMAAGATKSAQLAALGGLGVASFGPKVGIGASAFVLGMPWALARGLATPRAAEVLLRHAEAKGSRAGYKSAQLAALAFSRALSEAGIPHWVSDINGNPVEVAPHSDTPGVKPKSKF